MANVWRKRKGVQYDSWHFCRNCSNWPTTNYDERSTKPTTGEFCNECQGKKNRKACT